MAPRETLASLGAYAAVGAVASAIFFSSLRLTARLYLGGRWRGALLVQLARLLGLAGVLVAAASRGALPLLAVAAGLLAVRPLVIARLRKGGGP